jgi:hypothetical protein
LRTVVWERGLGRSRGASWQDELGRALSLEDLDRRLARFAGAPWVLLGLLILACLPSYFRVSWVQESFWGLAVSIWLLLGWSACAIGFELAIRRAKRRVRLALEAMDAETLRELDETRFCLATRRLIQSVGQARALL